MAAVEIKLFKTPKAILIDVGLAAYLTARVIGSVALNHVLTGGSVEALEFIIEKTPISTVID